MTRQERRKRRRQRRRRMQAGILLSLVLVLGLIIALRAGKERETLEQEIPLAAERQTLAYIAPAPALPDTAAEETPEEPEEPPVEPEPENRYAELHFSDEDVYILACLVYHEARGESFEGQVAVVEVVLNRMLSDYFPDTVEEVVFQKYGDVWQFSPAPYLYSAEPDSVQLEIFKRERNRVKERVGDGTWFWWLRSPRASSSSYFVYVNTDGTVNNYYANYSLGFAPGFDL